MSLDRTQQPVDSELIVHQLPAQPLSDEERAALQAHITGVETRPLSGALEALLTSLVMLREAIPRAETLTARLEPGQVTLKGGQAMIRSAHINLFLTLSLQADGARSLQRWQLSPEGLQLLFLIAPMESLRISEALDE